MTINPNILCPNSCQLLVVDLQEKFTPVIPHIDDILNATAFTIKVAGLLGIPITVTEQNPKGLGQTVTPISSLISDFDPKPKMTFSCWRTEEIRQTLIAHDRPTVLLAGVETSVCMLQTGLDLLRAGYQVYLLDDAMGGRVARDQQLALDRLVSAGALLGTSQTAAFELIERADSANFKSLLKLVKESSAK